MKIRSADVYVTSPGRNFVTLVVTTDDGVVGVGDATVNGRELSVASYLRDHLAPMLIGTDAHRIEDTWQLLYRGAYWRRGPITMAAIAAVDMALWDIKGKVAGLPVYQLIGGRSRDAITAYGHATGRDTEEVLDSVRAHLERGFTAVRVQSGVPGLGAVYGTPLRDGEAGVAHQPIVEQWDTPAYLRHMPSVFEAVRSEFGPELTLLHDAHHRLTPVQAARFARDLEQFDLFWLEDVTPAEGQDALRLVRQHSTTPLAIGEVFNSIHDYTTLFHERLIDYARSAVTHAGGITPLKRMFEMAALYHIKSGIHGPEDISPIGMAAALHIDISLHSFGIQEFAPHSDEVYEMFPHAYEFSRGHLQPGEAPGLGVDFDIAKALATPYERAYLPVNRLRDGTVHDW